MCTLSTYWPFKTVFFIKFMIHIHIYHKLNLKNQSIVSQGQERRLQALNLSGNPRNPGRTCKLRFKDSNPGASVHVLICWSRVSLSVPRHPAVYGYVIVKVIVYFCPYIVLCLLFIWAFLLPQFDVFNFFFFSENTAALQTRTISVRGESLLLISICELQLWLSLVIRCMCGDGDRQPDRTGWDYVVIFFLLLCLK